MSLKAVLFDLDDTLSDHHYSSHSALAALYQTYACFQRVGLDELEHQHSLLLEHYHHKLLQGEMTLEEVRYARFRDLLMLYDGCAPPATIESVLILYRETYYNSERLIAGALALLERLRTDDIRIAVVTNSTVAEQTGKLQRLGLAPLIDVLVISEAEGVPKPDPRIFRAALDRLGCSAHEAVMIGDSWTADIQGARAVGLRAIWLNRAELPCPDRTMALEIQALEPLETVFHIVMDSVSL